MFVKVFVYIGSPFLLAIFSRNSEYFIFFSSNNSQVEYDLQYKGGSLKALFFFSFIQAMHRMFQSNQMTQLLTSYQTAKKILASSPWWHMLNGGSKSTVIYRGHCFFHTLIRCSEYDYAQLLSFSLL